MSERNDDAIEETGETERALPEDDLEHYGGQWVALRDGTLVAHAPDLEALQADPAVLPTDDVFPVGDPPSGFYTVNA
jgi:hypothetical protein